ncbi:uncharacterized protein [Oryza sativa Japonica Group]|jgi:hypothetical protein|uniref:Os03g0217900 protein n=2 Tax=Oryza sativa subsp. japonica TaxID=39947 RepID=A0A8J8XF84_ORYSJ|nr:uncharacterized protein LOC4332076 [Oryza sativa Japonica Group]KAB8090827.1 hypothetical protein EE612_016149 [Oryza sativa]ABF94663.1 expressed protein [Oryza sativa Japonica Group]EAZ26078.1 hypothetical protein OsJ_09935 [Oryza sativa Japonica Group]KAF2938032.1 hypothetical protein DAI22_03g090900 [Oryza sativa Japonica Group]BAF11307.1 Os03g0217900 [Oryza sativa Japonica Group]|eukprot:NP_001049393.1 Os03g0217900 [Oryza sativa Japonica Group]
MPYVTSEAQARALLQVGGWPVGTLVHVVIVDAACRARRLDHTLRAMVARRGWVVVNRHAVLRVIRVSDLVHNILDITLPRLLDDAYDATQLTHFRRQAAALRTMAGVIGGNFRNRAYVVVRKIRFVASSARNHSMAAARLQQRLLDIRRRLSGLVEAPVHL